MTDCASPAPVVRTITAGINIDPARSLAPLGSAAGFLNQARRSFEEAGVSVQSTRIACQPLSGLLADGSSDAVQPALRELDRQARERGQIVSLGPLLEDDRTPAWFAEWCAELMATTESLFFSVTIASLAGGTHRQAIIAAARAMLSIARVGANGEANFRFGATARVPAGTPFFPAAYHWGPPAFAIGLESAGLVAAAFAEAADMETGGQRLRSLLEASLAPLERLADEISVRSGWRFLGFDLSPAPSLDVSIAAAIESLTGQPFGGPSTLIACATITRALDTARITRCGYSGLMLPVLEDRVLAQRAIEGRFGIQDLLLFSSVCGTGLDVIPIPGDTDPEELSRLLLDVAALATRLEKPLAARLLPIPGKRAGDEVAFDNPHLTRSVVMPLA